MNTKNNFPKEEVTYLSRFLSSVIMWMAFILIAAVFIEGCGTTMPWLTVISPNGGEVWVEGQIYEILWSANGIDKVSIELATGGKDLGHLEFEIDASLGRYTWTIPEGLISNFGIDRSDDMKIMLCSGENPSLCDQNDSPFTIVKRE